MSGPFMEKIKGGLISRLSTIGFGSLIVGREEILRTLMQ
jgi:hypothetical protein